jgi:hypothetical protein
MKQVKTQNPNQKTKRKSNPRSNNAEIARRVNAVYLELLGGGARGEIVQFCSKQWRVTARQIDDYIAAANALIEAEAAKTHDEQFQAHVGIRRAIRLRAREHGDLRMELDAAKDEAKLRDLYPDERSNVKHDFGATIADALKRLGETADASAGQSDPVRAGTAGVDGASEAGGVSADVARGESPTADR